MADDLSISVQIGADLSDLEAQLATASKLVGDFASSLSNTTANAAGTASAAQKKSASDAERSWNATAKGIENSMNTTIGGVLRGTTSLKAGLDKVAASIEQTFLGMALRVPEEWASGQLRMLVLSQEGEAGKTAAATSGAAARNAVGATENSSLFSRIAEAIAEWLGLETGKTAASSTGSATRSATDATANATGLIDTKVTAAANAASWAAVAAVAASASVAAIPIVGWAMAPGVAAATYADGMVYAALASAAGGWDQVPYDGALTELHKDEMVLPASIATPLRQSLASPQSNAAGQGAPVHFHFAPVVSAVDATGVDQLLQQHQDIFIKNVRNWHRNGKLGSKGALA